MSTLERIRELLEKLSPEQLNQVNRYVDSLAEPPQKPVEKGKSAKETAPKRSLKFDL